MKKMLAILCILMLLLAGCTQPKDPALEETVIEGAAGEAEPKEEVTDSTVVEAEKAEDFSGTHFYHSLFVYEETVYYEKSEINYSPTSIYTAPLRGGESVLLAENATLLGQAGSRMFYLQNERLYCAELQSGKARELQQYPGRNISLLGVEGDYAALLCHKDKAFSLELFDLAKNTYKSRPLEAPIFAPAFDDDAVWFLQAGSLKKISLADSSVQTLCDIGWIGGAERTFLYEGRLYLLRTDGLYCYDGEYRLIQSLEGLQNLSRESAFYDGKCYVEVKDGLWVYDMAAQKVASMESIRLSPLCGNENGVAYWDGRSVIVLRKGGKEVYPLEKNAAGGFGVYNIAVGEKGFAFFAGNKTFAAVYGGTVTEI